MFTFSAFPKEIGRAWSGTFHKKKGVSAQHDPVHAVSDSLTGVQQIELQIPLMQGSSGKSPRKSTPGVYYIVTGPLSDLLGPTFLNKYIRRAKTQIFAVSHRTEIDHGNTLAIIPGSKLILQVDKDTFERLGLAGTAINKASCPTGQRFQIVVKLGSKNYDPGSDMYKRLLWCLKRIAPVQLVVCNGVQGETGDTAPIEFPASFTVQKRAVSMTETLLPDVRVPDLPRWFKLLGVQERSASGTLVATDEIAAGFQDLDDWIGAVACRTLPLLQIFGLPPLPADDPDSFVSSYRCARSLPFEARGPRRTVEARRWRGMIPPSFARARLATARELVDSGTVPWAIITIWGFADSPCIWIRKGQPIPNSFMLRGQSPSHYSVVLLPQGGYMLLAPTQSN